MNTKNNEKEEKILCKFLLKSGKTMKTNGQNKNQPLNRLNAKPNPNYKFTLT